MQVNVTSVSGPSATVSGVVEYGVAVSVSPMLTVSASIPGTQGPPGDGGSISQDQGNQLQVGSDGGIFMDFPAVSSSQW